MKNDTMAGVLADILADWKEKVKDIENDLGEPIDPKGSWAVNIQRAEQVLREDKKKRRVLVHIEDGVIQSVFTNDSSIEVLTIDIDDQNDEPVSIVLQDIEVRQNFAELFIRDDEYNTEIYKEAFDKLSAMDWDKDTGVAGSLTDGWITKELVEAAKALLANFTGGDSKLAVQWKEAENLQLAVDTYEENLQAVWGVNYWTSDDIVEQLIERGIEATEINIAQVMSALDEEQLIGAMTTAGWDVIIDAVNEAFPDEDEDFTDENGSDEAKG